MKSRYNNLATCWHQSILVREETGVLGEKPRVSLNTSGREQAVGWSQSIEELNLGP